MSEVPVNECTKPWTHYEAVRGAAAAYQDAALRSLDAIHLATGDAVFGTMLDAFVTYDERLRAAAAAVGWPTAAPGR